MSAVPARRLTEAEWWALCAAIAQREEALDEYAEKGLAVGRDRAALTRAAAKLGDVAPADNGRRYRPRRAR